MGQAKGAQDRQNDLQRRRRHRADPHLAKGAAGMFLHLARGIAHLQPDARRPRRQRLPGRRQHHAAPGAQAQRLPGDPLHFRQHARGGGLRDAQPQRRQAQLPGFGQFGDQLQMAEFQAPALKAVAVVRH